MPIPDLSPSITGSHLADRRLSLEFTATTSPPSQPLWLRRHDDRPPFTRYADELAHRLLAASTSSATGSSTVTSERIDQIAIDRRLAERVGRQLHRLLLRTMVTALNSARRTRRLPGFTSDVARYEWFVDESLSVGPSTASGVQLDGLDAAQQAVVALEIAAVHEILERVHKHRSLLADVFGAQGTLVDISLPIGGQHTNGRSTTILSFDNGTKVVYKPRSTSGEVAYSKLVQLINGRYGTSLLAARAVDLGPFGFAEFVESANSPSMTRTAEGIGEITALAALLNWPSLWIDDIVASDRGPIAVDLATLVHPAGRVGSAQSSVADLGVLPTSSRASGQHRRLDLAFDRPARPFDSVRYVAPGTDKMLLHFDSVRPHAHPGHLVGLRPRSVSEFGRLMADGFERLVSHIVADRGWWTEQLRHACTDIQVRYVHRPDSFYTQTLEALTSMRALTDLDFRDAILDRVGSTVDSVRGLSRSEQVQLDVGDLPTFTIGGAEREIRDPDGQLTGATVPRSPIDEAERILDRFTPEQIRTDGATIRQAFEIETVATTYGAA